MTNSRVLLPILLSLMAGWHAHALADDAPAVLVETISAPLPSQLAGDGDRLAWQRVGAPLLDA